MPRKTVLLLLLALAGCSSGGNEPTVSMTSGQRFQPGSLSVQVGEEVVFGNESDQPHTVTAYENGLPPGADYFSSGGLGSEQAARAEVGDALLEPGEQYSVTLDRPGTYRYFCIPHEGQGMKAEIVVEG